MTLLAEPDTLTRVTATHHIPTPAMPPPAPPYRPARRSLGGAVALVVVGLIATAALIVGIVGLTRDNSAPTAAPPAAAPETPAFSSVEITAAKQRVCTAFERASEAVKVATSAPDGPEPVAASTNARASLVGGALMLTRSVTDATPHDLAVKADALADAYTEYVVQAFAEHRSDSSALQAATNDMREACA